VKERCRLSKSCFKLLLKLEQNTDIKFWPHKNKGRITVKTPESDPGVHRHGTFKGIYVTVQGAGLEYEFAVLNDIDAFERRVVKVVKIACVRKEWNGTDAE